MTIQKIRGKNQSRIYLDDLVDVNTSAIADGKMLQYSEEAKSFVCVDTPSGAEGVVLESDYIKDSVLCATVSGQPQPVTLMAGQVLGVPSKGVISALSSRDLIDIILKNEDTLFSPITRNIAQDKTYVLDPTAHASYPDESIVKVSVTGTTWTNPIHKLTDGILGTLDYADGLHVGWQSNASINLDLSVAHAGTKFVVCGMADTSAGINSPTGAKLEYADTNSNWSTFENRTSLATNTGNFLWRVWFDISAAGAHRYWKVTLTKDGTWLLVDEIQFFA